MLPSICYVVIRKHLGHHWISRSKCYLRLNSLRRRTTLAFLFLAIANVALTQEQNFRYTINRQGKKVGELSVKQVKTGSTTTYSIESEVKVSFLFSFTVKAKEQSVYESGVLQSSSLYRTVNGKEKANKQIKNNGSGLTVVDDGEEEQLKNYLVKYSMHCLYASEPLVYTNVFSDNYKQFVPIQKIADRQYKVKFPDGNSNEYHYENGICKKVVVKSSLFDAEFLLMN